MDNAGLPISVRAKASSDTLNQHLASEEEEERKVRGEREGGREKVREVLLMEKDDRRWKRK